MSVNGRRVKLTGRQRALLAVLLLEDGRVLSVGQIIDRLWGEVPPSSAAARVRALVAELRRACGPEGPRLFLTRNPGYVVETRDGRFDVRTFTGLVEEARRAVRRDRPADAVALYDRAAALWRGAPLAGAHGSFAEAEAARLEERLKTALEERCEAKLALGRFDEVVTEAGRIIAEDPLRERPRRHIMIALHRCGRSVEALEQYRDYRDRLVTELGVEPTRELQRLHQSVLSGDTGQERTPPSSVKKAVGPAPWVPRNLPAVPARFVGRGTELARLDELSGGPHRVVLVVGPAGSGKTTLTVRWAHTAADRFPDGQLFLDMRGFDRGGPLSTAEALPILLSILGWPAKDIPVDINAQTALYRSVLAGRRVLLVLDNVSSPDQVRPLLPGGSESLVVVTSRDRLGGLVALDGARRITLDVLAPNEAVDLIAYGAGEWRLDAEPDAMARLAGLCGYLPLALCVAGAQLADRQHRTIDEYADELVGRGRLERLRIQGDENSAVRAALDLSYRALPASARRLFRLAGLAPDGVLTPPAAAALAGVPRDEAEESLEAIARVHLATATGPRRYTWHDLVREHAAERGEEECAPRERATAVRRLLDHYLRTIVNVTRASRFHVLSLPYESESPDVLPETFDSRSEALAWVDDRWEAIAAATVWAAEHGPRPMAWLLVDAMQDVLHHRRPLAEWVRLAGTGLAAAEREDDLQGQAAMRISLGHARWRMADLSSSLAEYERALDLSRRAAWRQGEAVALRGSGVALKQLGEPGRALDRYRRSVELERELGNVNGEAKGLNNLASAQLMLGELGAAEESLLRALPLAQEIGDRHLESIVLVNLGLVWQKVAELDKAVEGLERSLTVAREAELAYAEAVTYETLGRVYNDAGDHRQAIEVLDRALQIARRVENQNCQVDALVGLARAKQRLDRPEEALGHLAEAKGIVDRTGHRAGLVETLMALAEVHRHRGRYAQARDHAEKAVELAQEDNQLLLATACGTFAAVLLDQGDHRGALEQCRSSLEISRRSGQRLVWARTLLVQGRALWKSGDEEGARSAWERARETLVAVGAPEREEAAALLG